MDLIAAILTVFGGAVLIAALFTKLVPAPGKRRKPERRAGKPDSSP